MTYDPIIDDYVKWDNNHTCHEGWVYFKCDDYITIEIRVKDKCEQNIKDCPIHKKTHVLLLCYRQFWNQLEYVKNRREDTISEYKSQEGRYIDP
tara:strand:- start:156 stop:437 length:282 start_codon:yes stop_codon:yes gene_type:complete